MPTTRAKAVSPAAVASGLLTGLVALAGTAVANDEAIGKGRALAERLCASCHMNPGQGEKVAPSGIPSFSAVANRPDAALDSIVAWLKSRPVMMPNHHLSQDEMFDLAEFILSLKRGE